MADVDDYFDGFGESEIGSDVDFDSDFDVSSVGSVSSVSSPEVSDISDGEDDEDVGQWTGHFTNFQVNDFIGPSGANLPEGFDVTTASAIDYFFLMMNPQTFNDMARHTNNYARWKMAQTGEEDNRWTETTTSEVRAFVGINILMGICSLPEADMYWSADTYIGNVGVQNVMTCNRFQKLSQYFHVSDRAAEPPRGHDDYDKLYKVRPIIEHVSQTFLERYNLSQEVSVDEAMVRYTGRLAFRQYMPAKPIKRGMKIWMACDANTAYLSRFDVYLGRQNNTTEHGLGHNVVAKLTDNIQNTHRRIFFDNFFTGIPLMNTLLEKGLYACGTVRVNRKDFPSDLKKPRDVRNRGDFKVRQKGTSNLTATVWKDKRLVHHLSTLSCPTTVKRARRRVGPTELELQQPASVHEYNKYMGGVDRHDQYRMKYDVGRNSKKWWRYLFWFLVNCAIVNGYIIYNQVSRRVTKKKRFAHVDFRMEVMRDLIGGFAKRKRSGIEMNNVGLVEGINVEGHVSCRLPGVKRRCRFHLNNLGVRRETVYGCHVCQVHLCRDGCHARFHNQ